MHLRLRDAHNQEVLLTSAGRALPGDPAAFVDAESAAHFLARFVAEPMAMRLLREELLPGSTPTSRADTRTLLHRLARQLVHQGVRVVRDPRTAPDEKPPIGEQPLPQAPPPQPSARPSPPEAPPAKTEAKPEPKPAAPPSEAPQKNKTLKVEWSPLEAYCADKVKLQGTATNFDPNTDATGEAIQDKKGTVDTVKGKGQTSFPLEWEVKNVVFDGPSMPPHYDIKGKLSAGGLTAETPNPLKVKRVPDKPVQAVSFARSSGVFGWTAAFRIGIDKDTIQIKQTLKIKKAWLGKWVSLDATLDGQGGWAFIKKVGAAWQFWDKTATPPAWKPLPRAVSSYTVNNLVFIRQGADYVARDNASFKWPEAFADPTDYEQKKTSWLANIHSVWDNKFDLHHKECKSASKECCLFRIRVTVNWSDASGDKDVYAVWAQDWERSNASDWYLTEQRLGVAAHECGHLLGAYDEYTGGAVDTATNKIENDSIMGQNLTKGFPRHLDGVRDQAKTLINGAISRSWTFEVKDA